MNRVQQFLTCWLFIGFSILSANLKAQDITVFGDYQNRSGTAGAAFFSGHVVPAQINGTVNADLPKNNQFGLSRSAFGQAVAGTVPFPSFQNIIADEVKATLYCSTATVCDTHAFRYKTILAEARTSQGIGLDDRLGTLWTSVDRDSALGEAETIIEALRYDPSNQGLRTALLDIYYDLTVADMLLAKELEADAQMSVLNFTDSRYNTPSGGFVINKEIDYLEQAKASYETAGQRYFQFLLSPLGIDTARASDAGDTSLPFAYHLFYKMASGRDYKDLILLFDLQKMYAQLSAKLLKSYILRDDQTDVDNARQLLADVQQRSYIDGQVLKGIFSDAEVSQIPESSGLIAAQAGWQQALTRFVGLSSVINSETNPLGLAPDMLALFSNGAVINGGVLNDSFAQLKSALLPDGVNAIGELGEAWGKYKAAFDDYTGFQLKSDQIQGELQNHRNLFASRLQTIAGCPHPSDISASVTGCTSYDKPTLNSAGLIYQQLQNIGQAKIRIERNGQEIDNLNRQIETEIERLGKANGVNNLIAETYIKYGNKQAKLTEEIARIRAKQAKKKGIASGIASIVSAVAGIMSGGATFAITGLASSIAVNGEVTVSDKSSGWGAFASGMVSGIGSILGGISDAKVINSIGALEAEKERLAAQQQAEITYLNGKIQAINSAAHVKGLLLNMSILAIDSESAALTMSQELSKLQALLDEQIYLEARWTASKDELASRYFADPVHRLILNDKVIEAEFVFKTAQRWLFWLVRAYEYRWNTSITENSIPAPDYSTHYTLNTIYKLRNAEELLDMAKAVYTANHTRTIGIKKDTQSITFSLREDFLGFKRLNANGETVLYPDPLTGESVDALTAFRSYLKHVAPHVVSKNLAGKEVVQLVFNTAKENLSGTFFNSGRWNEKNIWLSISINAESSESELVVWLEQNGMSYIRNQKRGAADTAQADRIKGEMRIWPVQRWTATGNAGEEFVHENFIGYAINAMIGSSLPATPPASVKKTEFQELSPATSRWVLEIPFRTTSGGQILDLDTVADIELQFENYYMAPRI
ncbi:MAG: hypothetical protein GY862_14135 [Gammaproteobacteria bacterium]|nr:hypothetical protein [Gammaproteobacteria bacterium]